MKTVRDETSKRDAVANENDYRTINRERLIRTHTHAFAGDLRMIGELTRLAVRSRARDQ